MKDLFDPINLNLSYQEDQLCRQIRGKSKLLKLYNKIKFKLDAIVRNYLDKKTKTYIELQSKSSQQSSGIAPFLTTEYCWNYWRNKGERNFNKIASLTINPKNYAQYILYQVCTNVSHELKLIPGHKDPILLFDSYWFFNGGHLAFLEETLDIINAHLSSAKCYFFIDRNSLLLPSLAKSILSKFRFVEIINCTNFPIAFPKQYRCQQLLKESFLALEQLKASEIKIQYGCLLNPCFGWSSKEQQIKQESIKASWQHIYTKEDSKNIIINHLKKTNLSVKFSEFVVIHSRNANFLAENIRNSLPLVRRAKLIEKINALGFGVLILGINKPEDKYYSDMVVYLDDLGIINDSFQIHAINAALAMIGSPSGVTHLSYCTDTPTLIFDSPFPRLPGLPKAKWLALMKPLLINKSRCGVSEYYKLKMNAYLQETDGSNKASSPLINLGFELGYCSNNVIFEGFIELIEKAYKEDYLEGIGVRLNDLRGDVGFSNEAYADRELIKKRYLQFQESGDNRAFNIDDLASSNWKDF